MKKKMKCNSPKKSTRAGKRKMVKACENGKERLLHYGQSGAKVNSSKSARKSFRARHKCNSKKSKLTRSYWACKDW